MIRHKIFILILIISFAKTTEAAQEIVWNGFASFYGRQSLTDTYDNNHSSKDLNFSDNTRVGLNMRSEISNEFAVVGQIVAAQRSSYDGPRWSPEFDWIFLNYLPKDDIDIRFGRQLNPGSIIGEYVDVGLTYPWRRLPEPFQFMVQFKSFEGVSAKYSMHFDQKTASVLAFGGNSRPYSATSPQYFYEIKNLYGLRIKLEGENWELQAVRAQYKYLGYSPSFTSGVPATVTDSGAPSRLTTVGGHFDNGKLMSYAEYSNIDCGKPNTTCGGWASYATLGYHISDWLPHFTYAKGSFQQVVPFAPASVSGYNDLTSQTLGLNYQINPSVVAKAEFIWQKGEGNGVLMMSGPGDAHSYSLGMDLVF